MLKLGSIVMLGLIAATPVALAEPPEETIRASDAVDVERDEVSERSPLLRGELVEERSHEMRRLAEDALKDTDTRDLLSSSDARVDFGMFDDGSQPAIQDADMERAEIVREETGDDATGTDPRGFSNKFMPYYRYAEARNDLEIQQFVLFGMFAFSPNFAMTYEWPVAKQIDYSDLLPGSIPPGGQPPFPPGGVPPSGLDPDGKEVGMGDLNLRFFLKLDALQGEYGWEDELNPHKGWSIMPIIETTLPTATEDALGGGSWILSPGFAIVTDIPGPAPFGLGFIAGMNFFDFDVLKDGGRSYTSRYRGRWFWMQPLTQPGAGLFDGLYVLTEFQPVYDFRQDHFSLWIGPEFGKIVFDGFIVYAKPGWGLINDEPTDREFSFELGMRYFF
jgi:hypothetical protein